MIINVCKNDKGKTKITKLESKPYILFDVPLTIACYISIQLCSNWRKPDGAKLGFFKQLPFIKYHGNEYTLYLKMLVSFKLHACKLSLPSWEEAFKLNQVSNSYLLFLFLLKNNCQGSWISYIYKSFQFIVKTDTFILHFLLTFREYIKKFLSIIASLSQDTFAQKLL